MNNSRLPGYIFSEVDSRCLLTHKSAFCDKQRKILPPKEVFCLHSKAGPLVVLAPFLLQSCTHHAPAARCSPGQGPAGSITARLPCRQQQSPQALVSFFPPFLHTLRRAALSAASSEGETSPVLLGKAALTLPVGRGFRCVPGEGSSVSPPSLPTRRAG